MTICKLRNARFFASLTKSHDAAAEFKPSPESIKSLRHRSMGISLQQCRRALVASKGDEENALQWLLQQNLIKGENAIRSRSLGASSATGFWFVEKENGVCALAQVLCETDFVAKNGHFIEFSREFARFSLRHPNIKQHILQEEDDNDGSDQLTSLPEEQEVLLKSLVGRLGERIKVNRLVLVEPDTDLRKSFLYAHGDSPYFGGYAGYLTLEASKEIVFESPLVEQLVQHFVGYQPDSIATFLGQSFLFDESKKVVDVLKDAGLTVIAGKWYAMK